MHRICELAELQSNTDALNNYFRDHPVSVGCMLGLGVGLIARAIDQLDPHLQREMRDCVLTLVMQTEMMRSPSYGCPTH